MEIVPSVHRVEGVSGSNVVLLLDEKMGVVDTGIAGNGPAIVSYIKKIGRDPGDLAWIVLTHHHGDHSGSAAELRDLTGAKIVAHKAETEVSKNGAVMLRKGNDGEPPPLWARMVLGWQRGPQPPPRVVAPKDTPVQQTVEEGSVLPGLSKLHIIHTPGHTPGSICPLFEGPQSVLFLGDSALNNINRLSRPLTWDRSKRRELDKSLAKLRELNAQAACFGHGPPVTEETMVKIRGMTDRPYDRPTWMIMLRNWKTLSRWHERRRKPGHWEGGAKPA